MSNPATPGCDGPENEFARQGGITNGAAWYVRYPTHLVNNEINTNPPAALHEKLLKVFFRISINLTLFRGENVLLLSDKRFGVFWEILNDKLTTYFSSAHSLK
jgi:hypothetical protein